MLHDFLLANKAEVTKMSIYEFNEEEYRATLREEAEAEGYERGKADGRAIGKTQGKAENLAELVRDGLLTREQALERCGLSAEEFDRLCEKLREEQKS